MDSIFGFQETLADDVVEEKSQGGLKLVPWISWNEWKFVRDSLFSSSPHCVSSALQRIFTWRSRGCTPVAVDVTASIVDIQQKDPFYRKDLYASAFQSEEMLAMLYCMAIMRLVNGVVEKTRKKNEISIGEAAEAIGIPRILIDIRHEGSHRDLPSLHLARLASQQALDWLLSYYWEPQEKAIPTQDNKTVNLKKEMKCRLHEVSLCLKSKQTKSQVETKSVRPEEHLFGRNKFLAPVAGGMSSPSNSTGYKKQLKKSLKNILRLYSSFSPEVVHVLLEFLINEIDSFNMVAHFENSEIEHNIELKKTALHDWKHVVLILSRKEPEFLLTLTQAVLEKLETKGAKICDTDGGLFPLKKATKNQEIELLALLFGWLIKNLKSLNLISQNESAETKDSASEKYLTKATLIGLLRRSLLVSFSASKPLISSALILARLIGDTSVFQKLKKLSILESPILKTDYVETCNATSEEESIRQAAEKLELIKRFHKQEKIEKAINYENRAKSKWVITKAWNPCPIGMLPHTVGFSGRLPVLECADERIEVVELSESKLDLEVNQCRKREAETSIEKLDVTCVKKSGSQKDCVAFVEDCDLYGGKGHLMIDGEWTKVGEKEMIDIASAVRLLL